MNSNSNPTVSVNPLSLEQIAKGMGHVARLRILKELSVGEARSISELAAVAGCNYDATIRHLTRLRKAGLIVQGRGRLYQIPPQFFPTRGEPVVDYGFCVLRLAGA